MSGCLAWTLIEPRPDQAVIVEVRATGHGHLGAFGQKQLRVGPAAGCEEISAVDHRGGQVEMANARAGPGMPGLAEVMLEALGRQIAEELQR